MGKTFNLLRMIGRGLDAFSTEGWSGVRTRLATRFSRFMRIEEVFLALELDLDHLVPRYTLRLGSNTIIRLLTPDDFDALSRRFDRYEMKVIRKHTDRLGKDIFGFLAIVDGTIVGHLWLTTERYEARPIRYTFGLGPRMVYSNGMVIDRDFRMKVIPGALVEYAYLYFKERGYTKTITITQTTQASSLRFSKNLGFREIHRIVSRRTVMVRRKPRFLYGGPEDAEMSRRSSIPTNENRSTSDLPSFASEKAPFHVDH